MPEQSIGMTTGLGDGVAGGYPASRMLTMETGMAGSGVLLYGGLLAASGTGTASLAIADGAALVSGYYYENTTSSTINVSTLANATYNLCVLVNASAATLAVSRSATGTTTPAYSVRVALFSGTPGVPYVLLGTVTVTSAVVASITPAYAMYAETRQLPYQNYMQMTGGSATLTTAGTGYDVTSYSASTVTNESIFSLNTTTGVVTVRRPGLYVVSMRCAFSTGTTGQRTMVLQLNGATNQTTTITPIAASSGAAMTWQIITTAVTDTISLAASATISTQNVASCTFTISRA